MDHPAPHAPAPREPDLRVVSALGLVGVGVAIASAVLTSTGRLVDRAAFAGIFMGMFLCVLAVVLHPGKPN